MSTFSFLIPVFVGQVPLVCNDLSPQLPQVCDATTSFCGVCEAEGACWPLVCVFHINTGTSFEFSLRTLRSQELLRNRNVTQYGHAHPRRAHVHTRRHRAVCYILSELTNSHSFYVT